MGANYCMSEFTASILLDQLAKFDAQCERRIAFVRSLETRLKEISGVEVVPILTQVDRRGFYELAFRINGGSLSHLRTETIAAALTAELGVRFYPPRAPLFDSVFFQPETKPRFHHNWDPARSLLCDYPGAKTYSTSTILLHHSALLADIDCASDIGTAFKKIETASALLADAEAKGRLASAVPTGTTPTRRGGSA
jgi:L-glutamine:2-deoxy-scyllo-inosose/3-amino-2,3-dideoxy-scyllo-inosose aminotransferase